MKKLIFLFVTVIIQFAANAQEAVVSPVNMNILYAGMSNPVEIAVPGVTSDNVTATVTNGTIKKTAGGWEIYVRNAGECIVSVYAGNKKVADKKFRIRTVPVPVAFFSGRSNGVISRDNAIRAARLEARIPDFDWDVDYNILSFTMLVKDGSADKEIKTTGNSLSDEMKYHLANLVSGQSLVFKDITANGPDGRPVTLSALVLKIE